MATDFKPKTQTFREPDVRTLDHRLTDLLPRPFGRPAGSLEEHDLAVGDRQVLQDAGGTSEAVIAHQPHAPRSAGARPEMRIRPAGSWQTRYQRLPPWAPRLVAQGCVDELRPGALEALRVPLRLSVIWSVRVR